MNACDQTVEQWIAAYDSTYSPIFSGPVPETVRAASLDINSDKGKKSVADVHLAYEIWCQHYPSSTIITTPEARESKLDGAIVVGGSIAYVFEAKCRYDLTREKLRTAFGNEWLVTEEKIRGSRVVAALLRVPLLGFLYLVDEDVLLVQRICNRDGSPAVKMRQATTVTQKTINGGSASRLNVFIDMSAAKELVRLKL